MRVWKGRSIVVALLALFVHANVTPQEDLDNARSKWPSDLEDYDFVYQRICFCPEEYVLPKYVRVREKRVETVTFNKTREVFKDMRPETVEELFDDIQEAINRPSDLISVNYDYTFGFPTSIYILHDERIPDAEINIKISSFEHDPRAEEPVSSKSSWEAFLETFFSWLGG